MEQQKRKQTSRGRHLMIGCKVMVAIMLVTIIVLGIVFAAEIDTGLNAFFDWMKDNAFVGSLILIIIFVIVSVLLLPAVPMILTLGAGYAYL